MSLVEHIKSFRKFEEVIKYGDENEENMKYKEAKIKHQRLKNKAKEEGTYNANDKVYDIDAYNEIKNKFKSAKGNIVCKDIEKMYRESKLHHLRLKLEQTKEILQTSLIKAWLRDIKKAQN